MEHLSFRLSKSPTIGHEIQESSSSVFIRCGRKVIKLDSRDISHVESAGNYAKFHTTYGTYLSIMTMKVLSEKLKELNFFRVNRKTIINKAWINSFNFHVLPMIMY